MRIKLWSPAADQISYEEVCNLTTHCSTRLATLYLHVSKNPKNFVSLPGGSAHLVPCDKLFCFPSSVSLVGRQIEGQRSLRTPLQALSRADDLAGKASRADRCTVQ